MHALSSSVIQNKTKKGTAKNSFDKICYVLGQTQCTVSVSGLHMFIYHVVHKNRRLICPKNNKICYIVEKLTALLYQFGVM